VAPEHNASLRVYALWPGQEPEVMAPPRAVQGVLLSNIARRDSVSAAADPADPWLELEVTESGAHLA
jgi:hypothetical protein